MLSAHILPISRNIGGAIAPPAPPVPLPLLKNHEKRQNLSSGGGTGGAGGPIAPPIFLEIDKIQPFSTPNISGLKEGAARKIH